MKNITLSALCCALCAVFSTSCTVRSHVAMADYGRSADGILVPLEQPTLHRVDKQWYMEGQRVNIERNNVSWVSTDHLPAEKRHPERYTLGSDETTPVYAAIPEDMAESIRKGKYTHSHAISFINRKWVDELPEGKTTRIKTKTNAPDYFRKMSSHRLIQTESNSYLLAHIGELTADFSSIIAYPMAGLCTLIVDTPASFFYSPPVQRRQVAQSEEVE